jgi:hypothetical protein
MCGLLLLDLNELPCTLRFCQFALAFAQLFLRERNEFGLVGHLRKPT